MTVFQRFLSVLTRPVTHHNVPFTLWVHSTTLRYTHTHYSTVLCSTMQILVVGDSHVWDLEPYFKLYDPDFQTFIVSKGDKSPRIFNEY